jgi:hypothetical protein
MAHPRKKVSLAASCVLSALVAGAVGAQESTTTTTPAPALDPTAVQALNRMANYLRTLNTFQIKAQITREEVLDDGQKITFGGTADMLAQRPNRLRVDVNSDRQQRLFLYDGKTFTVWAPRQKYFAEQSAPPTILGLLDELEDKHSLELPLLDLFRWGQNGDLKNLTSARDMGPSQIDGVSTQHYALRQDGLDWQVWIQNGDFPLPRKVILTTTTDEARPDYTAVYTWNLAPSISGEAFVFVAPDDAKKIPIEEVPSARASAGNR